MQIDINEREILRIIENNPLWLANQLSKIEPRHRIEQMIDMRIESDNISRNSHKRLHLMEASFSEYDGSTTYKITNEEIFQFELLNEGNHLDRVMLKGFPEGFFLYHKKLGILLSALMNGIHTYLYLNRDIIENIKQSHAERWLHVSTHDEIDLLFNNRHILIAGGDFISCILISNIIKDFIPKNIKILSLRCREDEYNLIEMVINRGTDSEKYLLCGVHKEQYIRQSLIFSDDKSVLISDVSFHLEEMDSQDIPVELGISLLGEEDRYSRNRIRFNPIRNNLESISIIM